MIDWVLFGVSVLALVGGVALVWKVMRTTDAAMKADRRWRRYR